MDVEEKKKLRDMREHIDNMQLAAENTTRNYLMARGWTNTSNTPGCYWMWEKEVIKGINADGSPRKIQVIVEEGFALNIQDHLDYMEELFEGLDGEDSDE